MTFAPIVFDSNVYLGFWIEGRYAEKLEWASRRYLVRQSSVVLHELRRGVRSKKGRGLVEALVRYAPKIYAPDSDDWWRAAEIIASIRTRDRRSKEETNRLQNDILIACTCRRNGFTLITANAKDLDLIRHYLDFQYLTW